MKGKGIILIGANAGLGIAAKRLTQAGYNIIAEQAPLKEPEPKPQPIVMQIKPYHHNFDGWNEPIIPKHTPPWYTHFDKFKKRKK